MVTSDIHNFFVNSFHILNMAYYLSFLARVLIGHLPFLVMTFAAPDAKKILDAKMGVYLVNFTTTESYA